MLTYYAFRWALAAYQTSAIITRLLQWILMSLFGEKRNTQKRDTRIKESSSALCVRMENSNSRTFLNLVFRRCCCCYCLHSKESNLFVQLFSSLTFLLIQNSVCFLITVQRWIDNPLTINMWHMICILCNETNIYGRLSLFFMEKEIRQSHMTSCVSIYRCLSSHKKAGVKWKKSWNTHTHTQATFLRWSVLSTKN